MRTRIVRLLLGFLVLITADVIDFLADIQQVIGWCGLRVTEFLISCTVLKASLCLPKEDRKQAIAPMRIAMRWWILMQDVAGTFQRAADRRKVRRLRDLLTGPVRIVVPRSSAQTRQDQGNDTIARHSSE